MVKESLHSNELYLPLDNMSYEMAGALFSIIFHLIHLVTNYDIQKVQEVYLRLWELDSRKTYIPIQSLLHYFDHNYHGLISNFFSKGMFNCGEFFTFACFFSFFNINGQIQLLLSMSKIYSNVIITKEQVNSFFRDYQSKKVLKDDVIDNLTKMMDNVPGFPNDTYSIKSFISILLANASFSNFLYQFKQAVINFIFLPSDYQRIHQRFTFYYDNANNPTIKPPREQCCDYLRRVTLTKQPHPYEFDFFPSNCGSDLKECKSNMVFLLKRKYGYCSRVESISNLQSTSLKKTLKSFRFNEGLSAYINPSSPYSFGSVRLAPRTSLHGYRGSNNISTISNISNHHIKTKTTI